MAVIAKFLLVTRFPCFIWLTPCSFPSVLVLCYYKLGEITELCNKAGPVKKRVSCPACRLSGANAVRLTHVLHGLGTGAGEEKGKLRSKVSKWKHSNFERECVKYPCLGDSSTDTLYPAMKAIVGQTGTEEEFGEPVVTSTQHILPPRGAPEIKIKGKGRIIHRALRRTTQRCVCPRFLISAPQSGRGPWRLLGGGKFGRWGWPGRFCNGTSAVWSQVWVLGQPKATGKPVSIQSICGMALGVQSPPDINLDTVSETTVFRKEWEEEDRFALFC